jgi:L-lactate utilization protein LutC
MYLAIYLNQKVPTDFCEKAIMLAKFSMLLKLPISLGSTFLNLYAILTIHRLILRWFRIFYYRLYVNSNIDVSDRCNIQEAGYAAYNPISLTDSSTLVIWMIMAQLLNYSPFEMPTPLELELANKSTVWDTSIVTPTVSEFTLAQPTMLEQFANQAIARSKEVNQGQNDPPKTGLEQMLDKVKDKQFVILGGTNHGNSKLTEFLAKPSTLEALKNSGVKHLVLETRKEFQELADKIYNSVNGGTQNIMPYTAEDFANNMRSEYTKAFDDPTTREAFTRLLGAIKGEDNLNLSDEQWEVYKNQLLDKMYGKALEQGRIIENAAKAGIPCICAEGQKDSLVSHSQFLLDIKTADIRKDQLKKANFDPAEQLKAEKKSDDLGKLRMSGDKKLANSILEKVGNDKTVIFYGAEHGKNKHDLDEALGEEKTIRFDLFSSEDARIQKKKDNDRVDDALPDGALMIDGRFVPYGS